MLSSDGNEIWRYQKESNYEPKYWLFLSDLKIYNKQIYVLYQQDSRNQGIIIFDENGNILNEKSINGREGDLTIDEAGNIYISYHGIR